MDELHYEASMVESSYGIGKIEGREEGKIEGERRKAIEIAKNLLDVLDDETIALKTDLSVEEIRSLR